MNLEDRLNFVWHNGVKIEYSMLVALAKGAGDYALAQPYLVSLLAHGLVYGYSDYIDLVNEISGLTIRWRRFLCLSRRLEKRMGRR